MLHLSAPPPPLGGALVVGIGRRGLVIESFITSIAHSLVNLMADESVSSGDAECPSKTNLFLAFQIAQRIHGKRVPEVIPAGGKQLRSQRESQLDIKSIVPLMSK